MILMICIDFQECLISLEKKAIEHTFYQQLVFLYQLYFLLSAFNFIDFFGFLVCNSDDCFGRCRLSKE